jgi:hypothetical protein
MEVRETVGTGFARTYDSGWKKALWAIFLAFFISWVIVALTTPGRNPVVVSGYFEGEYYNGLTIINDQNRVYKEDGCPTKFCYTYAEIWYRGSIRFNEDGIERQYNDVILKGEFFFDYIEVSPATVPTWLDTRGSFEGEVVKPGPGFFDWLKNNWFSIFLVIMLIALSIVHWWPKRVGINKDTIWVKNRFNHYLDKEWYTISTPKIIPQTETETMNKSWKVVSKCRNRITGESKWWQIIIREDGKSDGEQDMDVEMLEDVAGLPLATRREMREAEGRQYSEADMRERDMQISMLTQQKAMLDEPKKRREPKRDYAVKEDLYDQ